MKFFERKMNDETFSTHVSLQFWIFFHNIDCLRAALLQKPTDDEKTSLTGKCFGENSHSKSSWKLNRWGIENASQFTFYATCLCFSTTGNDFLVVRRWEKSLRKIHWKVLALSKLAQLEFSWKFSMENFYEKFQGSELLLIDRFSLQFHRFLIHQRFIFSTGKLSAWNFLKVTRNQKFISPVAKHNFPLLISDNDSNIESKNGNVGTFFARSFHDS